MSNSISKLRSDAFLRQHGRCFYCTAAMWLGSPDAFARTYRIPLGDAARFRCTAEHLVPRQEGGRNTASNIVAACQFCNATRHRRRKALSPALYRIRVRHRLGMYRWHPGRVHHLLASNEILAEVNTCTILTRCDCGGAKVVLTSR